MDSALKLLVLGVGALMTAVLIMGGVTLMSSGQSAMNQGTGMLDTSLSAYSDVDKTQYEGASVSGSQVVELIKTYWVKDNTCAILVSTKDGANVLYDYSGYTALLVGSKADELTNWPTATAGTSGTSFGSSTTDGIIKTFGTEAKTNQASPAGDLTSALADISNPASTQDCIGASLYRGNSSTVRNDHLSLCTREFGNGTPIASSVDDARKKIACETYDYASGYKAPTGSKAGYINLQGGIFKGSCQYDVNQNIRCITFVQTR